jgi:hypothetical protein
MLRWNASPRPGGWHFLMRDVPKVLLDLGMPPIPVIPQDPCMAGDILEAEGVILESLREAYTSGRGPWD